jgi:hypothetical protein
MDTTRHAITVTRGAQGWTWTLIDGDGATVAAGSANNQESAMKSAWRAAWIGQRPHLANIQEAAWGVPLKALGSFDRCSIRSISGNNSMEIESMI